MAVLIDVLSPGSSAAILNELLNNESIYNTLQNNCLEARKQLCWQEEEKKLLAFYQKKFPQ